MYRVTTRLAAEFHRPADLKIICKRQEAFASAVAAQDAVAMILTNRNFHTAIAEDGPTSLLLQPFPAPAQ